MSDELTWLTRAEVELIHINAIEVAGGAHGLRDANLLESALARPRNLHAYGENDLFQLAASYAEGISRNHSFVDGNKRTAHQSADIFLYKNGHELIVRDVDNRVKLMEDLAQGNVTREAAAEYIREHSRTIEREQSQPPQAKQNRPRPTPLPEGRPRPEKSGKPRPQPPGRKDPDRENR